LHKIDGDDKIAIFHNISDVKVLASVHQILIILQIAGYRILDPLQ